MSMGEITLFAQIPIFFAPCVLLYLPISVLTLNQDWSSNNSKKKTHKPNKKNKQKWVSGMHILLRILKKGIICFQRIDVRENLGRQKARCLPNLLGNFVDFAADSGILGFLRTVQPQLIRRSNQQSSTHLARRPRCQSTRSPVAWRMHMLTNSMYLHGDSQGHNDAYVCNT